MTKQEFLAGNPFTVGSKYSKGDSTYYFTPYETTQVHYQSKYDQV
jgi:hypothetical protein